MRTSNTSFSHWWALVFLWVVWRKQPIMVKCRCGGCVSLKTRSNLLFITIQCIMTIFMALLTYNRVIARRLTMSMGVLEEIDLVS